LLPAILGGGNSGEEDAREDEYNANSGQHINNFLKDYVMQPIGPAAGSGIPTLDDPGAFQPYDPMDPMGYGGAPVGPQMAPAGYPNTPGDDEIISMLPPGALEEMFLMAQEQMGGGQGQEQMGQAQGGEGYGDPFSDPAAAGPMGMLGMDPAAMQGDPMAGALDQLGLGGQPVGLEGLLGMFGGGAGDAAMGMLGNLAGPSLPLALLSKGRMGLGPIGNTPLGDLFGGGR
jgi:hypothetical protein